MADTELKSSNTALQIRKARTFHKRNGDRFRTGRAPSCPIYIRAGVTYVARVEVRHPFEGGGRNVASYCEHCARMHCPAITIGPKHRRAA